MLHAVGISRLSRKVIESSVLGDWFGDRKRADPMLYPRRVCDGNWFFPPPLHACTIRDVALTRRVTIAPHETRVLELLLQLRRRVRLRIRICGRTSKEKPRTGAESRLEVYRGAFDRKPYSYVLQCKTDGTETRERTPLSSNYNNNNVYCPGRTVAFFSALWTRVQFELILRLSLSAT